MTFVEYEGTVDTILSRICRMVGVTFPHDARGVERAKDALQDAVAIICGTRSWLWLMGEGRFKLVPGARKYRLNLQATAWPITNELGNLATGQTYTYRFDMDYTPTAVAEDGVVLTEQASIAEVDANAGSWYYDPATFSLYLHATDDSDILISTAVYAATGDGMSNLGVVSSMQCEGSESHSIISPAPADYYEKYLKTSTDSAEIPECYYPAGDGVYGFYPIPSVVKTIQVHYVKKHPDMRMGGTFLIPANLHPAICYVAKAIFKSDTEISVPTILADPFIMALMAEAQRLDSPLGHDLTTPICRPKLRQLTYKITDTTGAL